MSVCTLRNGVSSRKERTVMEKATVNTELYLSCLHPSGGSSQSLFVFFFSMRRKTFPTCLIWTRPDHEYALLVQPLGTSGDEKKIPD